MIKEEQGVDWKTASGKLANPRKKYYLKLDAKVVKEVESVRDEDDLSYLRKAMVSSGMCLNINELWEVRHLFFHLWEIRKKHPENFQNKTAAESLKLDDESTESN